MARIFKIRLDKCSMHLAKAKNAPASAGSNSKDYVKWLRSESWAPVVADVCLPIFGAVSYHTSIHR